MLSAKRLAAVALALVLAGALWVRFGYEPDPGSHRITIEHVDAADGDFAANPCRDRARRRRVGRAPWRGCGPVGKTLVSALRGRRQTLSP